MIDSITFLNQVLSSGAYSLNTVTNGVGCALKKWEPSIDELRHTSQELPYGAGVVATPTTHGRMVVEMEGDVMHNTATGYWTERLNLAKQFISALPVAKLGVLEFQLTGQSEVWALDSSLVGAPQIPVGLAGATISPWRIVLAGNDPWFRGQTKNQQTIVGLTSTVLTTLGNGNAPSWQDFTITGPINNPSLDWQGFPGAVSIGFNLSAGQTIVINIRDRTVRTGSGTNLYSVTSVPYGWFPFDPRLTNKNYKLNGTSTTGATQTVVGWYNSYII